jgi:hypothetical protein
MKKAESAIILLSSIVGIFGVIYTTTVKPGETISQWFNRVILRKTVTIPDPIPDPEPEPDPDPDPNPNPIEKTVNIIYPLEGSQVNATGFDISVTVINWDSTKQVRVRRENPLTGANTNWESMAQTGDSGTSYRYRMIVTDKSFTRIKVACWDNVTTTKFKSVIVSYITNPEPDPIPSDEDCPPYYHKDSSGLCKADSAIAPYGAILDSSLPMKVATQCYFSGGRWRFDVVNQSPENMVSPLDKTGSVYTGNFSYVAIWYNEKIKRIGDMDKGTLNTGDTEDIDVNYLSPRGMSHDEVLGAWRLYIYGVFDYPEVDFPEWNGETFKVIDLAGLKLKFLASHGFTVTEEKYP